MAKDSIKLIANNKKAYHDYFIEDTWETGISLHGTEVKSLRMGKCSIKESFVRIEKGEVFVYGMHIRLIPFSSCRRSMPFFRKKQKIKN